MARDPHDRPAPGTIEARNFDDDFVPGPTDYKDGIACPDFSTAKRAEQRELEMLREFLGKVRAANRLAPMYRGFQTMCEADVNQALFEYDRKRGR